MLVQDKPQTEVAVLVDTATGWGRRLIRGVRNYTRKHGPWQLWIETHGRQEALRLPGGWRGDGVIARISDHAVARHLQAIRLPVVNVSAVMLRGVRFPTVCNNIEASAQLAFEHFVDRGFHHFAYCGAGKLSFLEQHRRAFECVVAEHGANCHSYHPPRGESTKSSWRPHLKHLGEWLRQLPRPAAVFCWGTDRGQQVLHACRHYDLDVPGEIAILGGDDDELICTTTSPPMSGIITPSEQIGYGAARMLDLVMHGAPPPDEPLIIDPVGISTRQSTDTLAIADVDVAAAIRFIRSNSSRPIQVSDVLRVVPISRRSLERRFEQYLGRTPSEELRRVRLARAMELLLTTDLAIPEVASRAGFSSPQYFARIFAHEHGQTPLKYRNTLRAW